jgi:hypothetical protein
MNIKINIKLVNQKISNELIHYNFIWLWYFEMKLIYVLSRIIQKAWENENINDKIHLWYNIQNILLVSTQYVCYFYIYLFKMTLKHILKKIYIQLSLFEIVLISKTIKNS